MRTVGRVERCPIWYSAMAYNGAAGLSASGDGYVDTHCVYSGDNGGSNIPDAQYYDTYRTEPTYVCDGDDDGHSATFDSDWVTSTIVGDCGVCPWIPPFGMTYIPHCILPGYVYQTSGSGTSCF